MQTPGSCASYNGVQDPLCDAAPTEISGTGDHVPQGVTKVVVPEPISARAAEQGSDRASSALPGLLQPIVPCSQGNGGVEADHRSVLPQCLRALPELHYGDASVNPQGPSSGPVVNLPRSERCLLSHRDPPSRQDATYASVTTAPLGSSQYCHSGCQPVREYLPKCSNRY